MKAFSSHTHRELNQPGNNQGMKLMAKSFFFFVVFYGLLVFAQSQSSSSTEHILRTIANVVVSDGTFQFVDTQTNKNYQSAFDVPQNAELKIKSPFNDWRYWNGVLNIAMLRLGEALNENAYSDFVSKNISFCFDNYKYFEQKYNGEDKWDYPFGQFFVLQELDDGGAMGASVIEMYKSNSQDRYKEYTDKVVNHILHIQQRLPDGTLVRSFPTKWTIWADDLYMSISFLSRMGTLSGDEEYFNDAANQVINFHKYLFNDTKGLMYHGWYSDIKQNGVAFWGRANGWALLAQVDLLDRLPKDNQNRDTLLSLLQKHILGISRYQSANGLYHQLLDKTDSFLETSCTAMITYTIARAVNQGYIDKRYSSVAQNGWNGLLQKINSDGKIEGICAGTGISDNLVDYYNRPTPLNDIHGIGAVLLAGIETLKIDK